MDVWIRNNQFWYFFMANIVALCNASFTLPMLSFTLLFKPPAHGKAHLTVSIHNTFRGKCNLCLIYKPSCL